MKFFLWLSLVLVLIWACDNTGTSGGATSSGELVSLNDSISYAQGLRMAQQIKKIQIDGEEPLMNSVALKKGFDAGISGENVLFTEQQSISVLNKFQKAMQDATQKKQRAEGKINRAKGEAFLAANANREGVITTASGLQYMVIEAGTGISPTKNDRVEVNYEGRLIDGTIFDTSASRGGPAKFAVTAVIPGWIEGIQLMREGAKYQFYIPADLAYGDQGSPPLITPGSTLIFDIALLKVNP